MENNKIRDKFVTEQLKKYTRQEIKSLSIGLLFSLLRTGTEIVGPVIIGYILNNHISLQMERADFISIGKLLGIYLVINILRGVFSNLAIVFLKEQLIIFPSVCKKMFTGM